MSSAITAMTTSNSMSVKARREEARWVTESCAIRNQGMGDGEFEYKEKQRQKNNPRVKE